MSLPKKADVYQDFHPIPGAEYHKLGTSIFGGHDVTAVVPTMKDAFHAHTAHMEMADEQVQLIKKIIADQTPTDTPEPITPEQPQPKSGLEKHKSMGHLALRLNSKGAEKRKEVFDAEEWIAKNVSYDDSSCQIKYDPASIIETGQKDAIIQTLIQSRALDRQMQECSMGPSRRKIITRTTLNGLVPKVGILSPETATALVDAQCYRIVLANPNSFPDLVFDRSLMMKVLDQDSGAPTMILEYLHNFGIDDAQYAIDWLVSENYCAEVLRSYFELPKGIHIPEKAVIEAIDQDPYVVLEVLWRDESGDIIKKDFAFINSLARHGYKYLDLVINKGFLKDLTAAEVIKLASEHECHMSIISCASLYDKAVVEAVCEDAVRAGGCSLRNIAARGGESVGSWVFERMRELPVDEVTMITALSLKGLSHDQYLDMIDRYFERIQQHASLSQLKAAVAHSPDLASMAWVADKLQPLIAEKEERRDRLAQMSDRYERQRDAEQSYYDAHAYDINPEAYDQPIDPERLLEAFEVNHCVKRAPHITDQIGDTSRAETNVMYLRDRKEPGGTGTHRAHSSDRIICSEQDALVRYVDVMREGIAAESDPDKVELLTSLIDNLTFIGYKEYIEATAGIANYWKLLLERDPEQKIFIMKGAISLPSSYRVKSDEYMFDQIMAHFTDDEIEKYADRLLVDEDEMGEIDPAHLRIVLLDDWVISGSQMVRATQRLMKKYPDMRGCFEVHLITASEKRVALGLDKVYVDLGYNDEFDFFVQTGASLPVRAYYVAHDAPLMQHDSSESCGTHITGWHSSVDYGFEVSIAEKLIGCLPGSYMPALTNIVRPYRMEGYESVNTQRFLDRKRRSRQARTDALAAKWYNNSI